MKRAFYFVFVLLMLGLTACGAPAAETTPSAPVATQAPTAEPTEEPAPELAVVEFTDPVLEEQIRKAMNKPESDITLEEAEQITELDLNMENAGSVARIADVSDLVQFPNLTYLNLGWALNNGDKAVDISPLADLKKLGVLHLNCNNIDDISALAGLTDMMDLKIWGNSIKDISALTGMTMMEDLWIQGNQITDISALSGMTINLYRLYLDDNQITDVTPLAGLTKLTSLKLGGNPVEDYSPLADIYQNLEEKDFELN